MDAYTYSYTKAIVTTWTDKKLNLVVPWRIHLLHGSNILVTTPVRRRFDSTELVGVQIYPVLKYLHFPMQPKYHMRYNNVIIIIVPSRSASVLSQRLLLNQKVEHIECQKPSPSSIILLLRYINFSMPNSIKHFSKQIPTLKLTI